MHREAILGSIKEFLGKAADMAVPCRMIAELGRR
jgi:hypothetical protein